jgi:serine/threonine-protein kinase
MLIDSPGARDHVKVLDFGIGKAIEETKASSMVSTVVGTPHYASPEQLTIGGRIDGRSDIYSLGIILYRMIGGKLPFNSPSLGEVIQMQLTSEPEPLITRRPETPHAVERLVAGMLAKDPARRLQGAAEVIAALDQALPYPEKTDVAPTGDTTIQRARNPLERTTEGMSADAPPRETFSTNVVRSKRVKTPAVYVAIIGAALAAAGFGVYHYLSDGAASDERQAISPASVESLPSPSATAAVITTPSPKPAAVVTPPSATTTPPGNRPKETPAPTNRPQPDNRRLANNHYDRAVELVGQRRYRDALKECNEALRLNPQHRFARRLRNQISKTIEILKPQ